VQAVFQPYKRHLVYSPQTQQRRLSVEKLVQLEDPFAGLRFEKRRVEPRQDRRRRDLRDLRLLREIFSQFRGAVLRDVAAQPSELRLGVEQACWLDGSEQFTQFLRAG